MRGLVCFVQTIAVFWLFCRFLGLVCSWVAVFLVVFCGSRGFCFGSLRSLGSALPFGSTTLPLSHALLVPLQQLVCPSSPPALVEHEWG